MGADWVSTAVVAVVGGVMVDRRVAGGGWAGEGVGEGVGEGGGGKAIRLWGAEEGMGWGRDGIMMRVCVGGRHSAGVAGVMVVLCVRDHLVGLSCTSHCQDLRAWQGCPAATALFTRHPSPHTHTPSHSEHVPPPLSLHPLLH